MAATNRRQLLTGAAAYSAGAAIVAGGAALASEAKGATLDRSAWDRALREHARAAAAIEAHAPAVQRAHDDWRANAPTGDNVEMEVFFPLTRRHVLERVDPDKFEQDLFSSIGVNWHPREADKAKARAQIQTLRDYHAAQQAARDRFSVDAVFQRESELDEALCASIDTLLQMPAPDADALAWKLNELFSPTDDGETASWSHDYVKQTLADAVRLAGGTPTGALA